MDEKLIKAFSALDKLEREGFCLEVYRDIEDAFPGTFAAIDSRKLTLNPSNTLRSVATESVDWSKLATTGLKIAAAGGVIGLIIAIISKAFGGSSSGGGGGGSATPLDAVKAQSSHARGAQRAAKNSFDKRTKSKKILTSPSAAAVVNICKEKNIENIPAVVELVRSTEPDNQNQHDTTASDEQKQLDITDRRMEYTDKLKSLRIKAPVVAMGVCSKNGVSGRLIAISMTKISGRLRTWSSLAYNIIDSVDELVELLYKASDNAPFFTETIKRIESRIRDEYKEVSKMSGWESGELRDAVNKYSAVRYRMLPGEGFEEPVSMLSAHDPASSNFEGISRSLAELEERANTLTEKVKLLTNYESTSAFTQERKRELDKTAKTINVALAPISFVIRAHRAERKEYDRLAARFDSLL